ncbi:hypothetical protein HPB48_007763 [Haemaphysalis longicornis]|uniref:G-protein coupled receptors family 2 profile 2 domain-containing protein n=1 Tax=Haemaphysalis longicornis TaxID=44386 RepID=A0A9J6FZG0_HAELO|nr:hypothetical protein HPB48_007763 [Haemaphysalis longicornis]
MKSLVVLSVLGAVFLTDVYCFENECNATLSWNVAPEDHPDIPRERIEDLLRCPEELHGCSDTRVNCTERLYAVTCSCADNCQSYGYCCWDAGLKLKSAVAAKCIEHNVDKKNGRDFYAITGCHPNWPDDEVRSSCENATNLKEDFYLIPVTSERQVTYFNGFCALCNYDLDNTSVFWNASGSGTNLQVSPPQYALDNKDVFFWPCDPYLVNVKTCPENASTEIRRKCSTYFAPVRTEDNETEEETVYNNVYCGLCNGVQLSLMKCVPKQVVLETWSRIQFKSKTRFSLVDLVRPVVSQGSCFSWHNDKCYIKAPHYAFYNTSTVAENETMLNSTNITMTGHEDYNVQSYLTFICISLSLICLFLKFVVYVLNKSSRTFSSRCTLCLSGTLFWSHLLFLLGNSFDAPKPVCIGVAIVLHYGFLSTFFWTSVLSFDIWKNVAATRLSSSRTGGFLLYSLIAWGGPVVVVALCAVLNWTVPEFVLSPRYGHFSCWIGSLWSQLTFFLMPMVVLLILDIGFYIHIIVKIRNTAKRAAAFDFKGGGNQSHMGLFVKLAFIMGTTWLLGFVAAFVNTLALDIIVIVLIGLQGVYLFFGFKDYQHLLPKRFRKRKAVATGVSTAHTEMSSSGRDLSERDVVYRSPAAVEPEKTK